MRSSTLLLVALFLAGVFTLGTSGCYTIIAVDESPASIESTPTELAPAILILPPPPPPVPAYGPVSVPLPAQSAPKATARRTSGPQRESAEPSRTAPPSDQRPVRTGRSR